MAWQLDRDLYGPERPTVRDIEPLNRVFSESFTDRYRRDGLLGVRVPHLNPLIWRYALEDAGDGAMVWRDGDGELAGFNVVHFSGSEGWMGPLAVRPDRQGIGLGKEMIRSGIDWLHEKAVQTIGLETMPRTIENIGFYSRLGFLPGHLTITLTRDLPRKPGLAPELASHAAAVRVDRVLECRTLTTRLAPGIDFAREIQLTLELKIGDVALVRRDDGALSGFALFHSAPLAAGRPQDELRILKLVAEDVESFEAVIAAAETAAMGMGLRRLSMRCQTGYCNAYLRLIQAGYRTHWTDLRMTLNGHPEVVPAAGAVVMSNWEI